MKREQSESLLRDVASWPGFGPWPNLVDAPRGLLPEGDPNRVRLGARDPERTSDAPVECAAKTSSLLYDRMLR